MIRSENFSMSKKINTYLPLDFFFLFFFFEGYQSSEIYEITRNFNLPVGLAMLNQRWLGIRCWDWIGLDWIGVGIKLRARS